MIKDCKIHHVEKTESTQDEILKYVSELTDEKLIAVIAKEQTSGRGRYGRKWTQFEDSLIFSFMIYPKSQPENRWSEISYIAGISIIESLLKVDATLNLELKWVNDVLLNGKKVSGILLERKGDSPLIIGIAVNIKGSSPDLPNAIALTEATDKFTKEKLGEIFFDRFKFYYNLWCENGFEPIKSLWLKRAKGVGKEITVNRVDSSVSGVFLGVDDLGNLQLLKDNKVQIINAGEIYFGAKKDYESARA